MQTIYLAQKNADLNEGRGPMVIIAAFFKRPDAKEAAKGWGVMGHGDGEVTSLIVYDSFKEYDELSKEEFRQSGLRKLSQREKKALGLE